MTTECDNADGRATSGSDRYRVKASESPSMAVVRAVAATSGRNVIGSDDATSGLEPLAETVDPEALDRIFGRGDEDRSDAVAEFRYCDHRVTIRGGETVCVTVQ